MKGIENFAFIVSEGRLSDSELRDYVYVMEGKVVPVMIYKFAYVPPYERNSNFIKNFQYRSTYKPFQDETQKKKITVINISEWIGHENEEKLEIFVKFLHDNVSFFDLEYVFVAEKANKHDVHDLFETVSQYLGKGKLVDEKVIEGKEAA